MRLTKHHGLGNDFLVLLDRSGDQPVDGELARAVCDRYRGIGADGLIRAFPPAPSEAADAEPPDAVMELLNADGSRAEMSGNGIRCLVQALVLDGWVEPKVDGPTQVAVRTDAGLRTVVVHREIDATTHLLSVDMGPVRFDPSGSHWVGGPFVRSAWARHRRPLPDSSAEVPSEFHSSMRTSASSSGRARIRPSAPTPLVRSQRARARSGPASSEAVRSRSTRKSLPSPWCLVSGRCMVR